MTLTACAILKAVILDTDVIFSADLADVLTDFNYEVFRAEDRQTAQRLIEENGIVLLLLGMGYARENAIANLRWAKARFPCLEVVILSSEDRFWDGFNAMKFGALDLLIKSENILEFVPVIDRAMEKAAKRLLCGGGGSPVTVMDSTPATVSIPDILGTCGKILRTAVPSLSGAFAAPEKLNDNRWFQARKLEAMSRLSVRIAHDLNNILGSIEGYAGLARKSLPISDPARGDMETIRKSAMRAAEITSQLTFLGVKRPLRNQAVMMDGFFAELVKAAKRAIGETITLDAAPGRGLGSVMGDAGSLSQALLNLVENAREALPAGGMVRLTAIMADIPCAQRGCAAPVEPGRKFVRISVEDNGAGMDKATLDRLFEPFFTTKSRHIKKGLGLSTAYTIVRQHNGWIDVWSEVGKGSVFTVHLPLQPAVTNKASGPEAVTGTEEESGTELPDEGGAEYLSDSPNAEEQAVRDIAGDFNNILDTITVNIKFLRAKVKNDNVATELLNGVACACDTAKGLSDRLLGYAGGKAPAVHMPQAAVARGGRVLIMDDDIPLTRVLKRILRGLDYQAESAANGKAALDVYRDALRAGKPYDAVILDLGSTDGMGGCETMARLKALDPKAKCIISSGDSAHPAMTDFEAHGFSGVLLKPYKTKEISEVLRRLIGPA